MKLHGTMRAWCVGVCCLYSALRAMRVVPCVVCGPARRRPAGDFGTQTRLKLCNCCAATPAPRFEAGGALFLKYYKKVRPRRPQLNKILKASADFGLFSAPQMRLNLSPNGLKPASPPQIDKILKASSCCITELCLLLCVVGVSVMSACDGGRCQCKMPPITRADGPRRSEPKLFSRTGSLPSPGK